MLKEINLQQPQEMPAPVKPPEVPPRFDLQEPFAADDDTETLHDDDPFENPPPFEIPKPGEDP